MQNKLYIIKSKCVFESNSWGLKHNEYINSNEK